MSRGNDNVPTVKYNWNNELSFEKNTGLLDQCHISWLTTTRNRPTWLAQCLTIPIGVSVQLLRVQQSGLVCCSQLRPLHFVSYPLSGGAPSVSHAERLWPAYLAPLVLGLVSHHHITTPSRCLHGPLKSPPTHPRPLTTGPERGSFGPHHKILEPCHIIEVPRGSRKGWPRPQTFGEKIKCLFITRAHNQGLLPLFLKVSLYLCCSESNVGGGSRAYDGWAPCQLKTPLKGPWRRRGNCWEEQKRKEFPWQWVIISNVFFTNLAPLIFDALRPPYWELQPYKTATAQ